MCPVRKTKWQPCSAVWCYLLVQAWKGSAICNIKALLSQLGNKLGYKVHIKHDQPSLPKLSSAIVFLFWHSSHNEATVTVHNTKDSHHATVKITGKHQQQEQVGQ